MFRFDEGLKVYLHRDPADFRLGINELSILVEQAMRVSPMSSALFVFGNRRRDQIKILGWQGNGFWLFLKRLEADPLRLAERSGDGGLERGAIALAARWHRPGGCPQAPAALLRAGWLNVLRRQRSNHDAAPPVAQFYFGADNIGKIRLGIEAVQARRADETVHSRRALAAVIGTDEQEDAPDLS